MPPPRVKSKPRSRNKDGRWRKKRSDTGRSKARHEEGEVKRPLQVSDEKQENGKDSLSEEVVAKIQERIREYRTKERGRVMSLASEEHRCYFCGDHKDVGLIPVCKSCLDSFNEYISQALDGDDHKGDGKKDE